MSIAHRIQSRKPHGTVFSRWLSLKSWTPAFVALFTLLPQLLTEGMSIFKSHSLLRCGFSFQYATQANHRTRFVGRGIYSSVLNARKRRFTPPPMDENHEESPDESDESSAVISSPMDDSDWKWKEIEQTPSKRGKATGRGRSTKRSDHYRQLSSYHSTFLSLLTAEYRVEVELWNTE